MKRRRWRISCASLVASIYCSPRRAAFALVGGTVLMACILLLGALPTAGVQAATGSCFGYDWTFNGIPNAKTYQAAQDVEYSLDSAGYSANSYLNNSGWAAYNSLSTASIWYFCYHAGPGYVSSTRPHNGALIDQYINAEPYVENSPADPYLDEARYYLNKAKRVDITQLLLVVFQGCHSSQYRPYHYPDQKYNLPHVLTAEKGVDTAMGFYSSVSFANWNGWNNPAKVWAHFFFDHLRYGYTVSQSQTYAISEYHDIWGDFGGYDSGQIFGNTSLRITPARNGAED